MCKSACVSACTYYTYVCMSAFVLIACRHIYAHLRWLHDCMVIKASLWPVCIYTVHIYKLQVLQAVMHILRLELCASSVHELLWKSLRAYFCLYHNIIRTCASMCKYTKGRESPGKLGCTAAADQYMNLGRVSGFLPAGSINTG